MARMLLNCWICVAKNNGFPNKIHLTHERTSLRAWAGRDNKGSAGLVPGTHFDGADRGTDCQRLFSEGDFAERDIAGVGAGRVRDVEFHDTTRINLHAAGRSIRTIRIDGDGGRGAAAEHSGARTFCFCGALSRFALRGAFLSFSWGHSTSPQDAGLVSTVETWVRNHTL